VVVERYFDVPPSFKQTADGLGLRFREGTWAAIVVTTNLACRADFIEPKFEIVVAGQVDTEQIRTITTFRLGSRNVSILALVV
jgi:hypothetical protein